MKLLVGGKTTMPEKAIREKIDTQSLDKVWITLLEANEFVECRRYCGFNRTITEIDGKRVVRRLPPRDGQ